MLKKYYNTKQEVYVLGDIHGHFDKLNDFILLRDFLSNCILIIAGDCCFGFKSLEYYSTKMIELNNTLKNKNVMLYFLRGNHDDSSYFTEEKINFSNLKTIPDYSIITVGDKNILCVGGAISIDRVLRVEEYDIEKFNFKNQNNKKQIFPTYWKSEKPVFDEDILNEINAKGVNINYVVTHTSPSFCFINDLTAIKKWTDSDKKLFDDLKEERLVLDKIYNWLISSGHKIDTWTYGHFHNHNDEVIDGIRFVTLMNIEKGFDIFELIK